MPPPPPRAVLMLFSLLCVLVGVSALFRTGQSFTTWPPEWFVVGFEVIVLISSAMGLMIGRTRIRGFREGPALAMACVAGATLVSVASSGAASGTGFTSLAADPFTLARIALAMAMGALAALSVLARQPRRSLRALVIGGVLCAGALVILVSAFIPGVRSALGSLNPILVTVGVVIASMLFITLVSVGGHCIIRAFEYGDEDAPQHAAAATPAPGGKPNPGSPPPAPAKA